MTRTLITAGLVLPGPAGTATTDGAILIDGSSIVAVGPRAEVERSCGPEVRRRSFPTSTVVPGLIDAHVHLAFDGSDDPRTATTRPSPAELLDAMAARAHRLLRRGVTAARDLGDVDRATLALRASTRTEEWLIPRLALATTPLTPPGGHCWFLGGEVESIDDVRRLIDANAAAGADVIKVMASGGALTPGGAALWEAQFTRAQLRTIVDHAGQHHLPVAAHAHGSDTIADSVDAGVATIEHCSWRTPDGLEYRADVAAAMVEQGIAVCRCVSGDWRDFLTRLGDNAQPLADAIVSMRECGVQFIAGTDAGVPGADFGDHVGMLEFFAHLGFAGGELLEMATVDAAHACGFVDTGLLAASRTADLLVVDGDPRGDISALRRIETIIAGGVDVEPIPADRPQREQR